MKYYSTMKVEIYIDNVLIKQLDTYADEMINDLVFKVHVLNSLKLEDILNKINNEFIRELLYYYRVAMIDDKTILVLVNMSDICFHYSEIGEGVSRIRLTSFFTIGVYEIVRAYLYVKLLRQLNLLDKVVKWLEIENYQTYEIVNKIAILPFDLFYKLEEHKVIPNGVDTIFTTFFIHLTSRISESLSIIDRNINEYLGSICRSP